jgi:hypothetical protein
MNSSQCLNEPKTSGIIRFLHQPQLTRTHATATTNRIAQEARDPAKGNDARV